MSESYVHNVSGSMKNKMSTVLSLYLCFRRKMTQPHLTMSIELNSTLTSPVLSVLYSPALNY